MKIFCIGGKAQHGKDTVAGFMRAELSPKGRVLICHYGDLVKYICARFFDWDGKKDAQGRRILQYVGTDIVRAQNPDYWTDFLKGIFKMFPLQWDYVLIPDCRFPNEIDCLKEFDPVYIRVNRKNFESLLTPEQQAHPSETALDDRVPDILINNAGTLEDLQKTVKALCEQCIE